MTKKEALALYKTEWWRRKSFQEICEAQFNEPKLIMPFTIFHEAVEKVLCRPVFTHEFASKSLKEEYLMKKKKDEKKIEINIDKKLYKRIEKYAKLMGYSTEWAIIWCLTHSHWPEPKFYVKNLTKRPRKKK